MMLRLIQDVNVTGSFGLAADETLAHRVGSGESFPTLRLYTYRPWSALVGRFQTVEHEVQMDFCGEEGIDINRRPTGGGAILMGDGQLGVALCLPGRTEDCYGAARAHMDLFSRGLVDALAAFGIASSFRRKNDLEVDGRKIAGLGMYRDPSGGLLFHASLLLSMNVAFMLKVLKTPFEKVSDKEIAAVEHRITTMDRERGSAVSLGEVRQSVASSYGRLLGAEIRESGFTNEELLDIRKLEREKYSSEDWIHQRIPVSDRVGSSRFKTPAGMVEVTIALAGETIKSAHIRGDFFASESALADLEGSLRWHATGDAALRNTVESFFERRRDAFAGLGAQEILRVLRQAVERARLQNRPPADPYGCFVNPGAAHAAL